MVEGLAIVFNDEIHALSPASYANKHFKYDGTSWSLVGSTPYTIKYGGIVNMSDGIHVLSSAVGNYANSHYRYDGESWTNVGSYVTGLQYGDRNACVINDELYIVSGVSSGRSNFFKWDKISWTELPIFTHALSEGKVIAIADEVHTLGGGSGQEQWHRMFKNGIWSNLDNINWTFTCGALVIYDNSIYALGGGPSSTASTTYNNYQIASLAYNKI